MTIGSVGTLTCDISSRKYFLAISVLVTATMSFSGFAQLWSGESKVDRLVFVFAEALHCKYFGFLLQVLHHLRCCSLSGRAIKLLNGIRID